MTRLNKWLRDEILKNALTKAGTYAAKEATAKKRGDWVEAVRIASLGEHAGLLAKLEAEVERIRKRVPEAFRDDDDRGPILTRGAMSVNCVGMRLHLNSWEGRKVAPSQFTITADSPLAQQFHDICAEEKANAERWDKIKTNVNAALYAVTTVKALLKAWPEAKELLPTYVEEAKVQLPAIRVADLNALVGLPTEK